MSNGNTPDGDKKPKIFTPLVQNNMKITGAKNPEILQGIKNGKEDYYAWAFSKDFINIDLQDEYFVKAEIFSEYHAKCNDTIIIMDSIRYIRLKGKNNKNEEFHIINFKII